MKLYNKLKEGLLALVSKISRDRSIQNVDGECDILVEVMFDIDNFSVYYEYLMSISTNTRLKTITTGFKKSDDVIDGLMAIYETVRDSKDSTMRFWRTYYNKVVLRNLIPEREISLYTFSEKSDYSHGQRYGEFIKTIALLMMDINKAVENRCDDNYRKMVIFHIEPFLVEIKKLSKLN